MRTRLAVALAVATACTLAPLAARAGTVFVTTPTGVSKSDVCAIEVRIKEAIKKAGHKIVLSQASLEDSAAAIGCASTEASCVARIAGAAGAEWLVAPSASPSHSGRLKVRLGLYRGTDGASVGDTDVSVERASSPGE